MWDHVKDWSGVISIVALVVLWMTRAIGFEAQTTGERLDRVEQTTTELRAFKLDQERVNLRLQIWMCVTDRQSAVMAQVPCSALGVGAGR